MILYLEVRTQSAKEVFFLAANNRVAPLKKMSMPRLEFPGCLLLSELVSQVKTVSEQKVPGTATVLRGSGVVRSGVISPLIWVNK